MMGNLWGCWQVHASCLKTSTDPCLHHKLPHALSIVTSISACEVQHCARYLWNRYPANSSKLNCSDHLSTTNPMITSPSAYFNIRLAIWRKRAVCYQNAVSKIEDEVSTRCLTRLPHQHAHLPWPIPPRHRGRGLNSQPSPRSQPYLIAPIMQHSYDIRFRFKGSGDLGHAVERMMFSSYIAVILQR
jgi:hypothetical protein